MGNDISQQAHDDPNRADPPDGSTDNCSSTGSGFAEASTVTDKISNVTSTRKRGLVVSGQYLEASLESFRREPKQIYRSTSKLVENFASCSEEAQAAVIQQLKLKSYQAILLHASATGQNSVLNLSYSVTITLCGEQKQARRILVTARGTPTVIVLGIPVVSQQPKHTSFSSIAICAY
jgi:hypothetical protein